MSATSLKVRPETHERRANRKGSQPDHAAKERANVVALHCHSHWVFCRGSSFACTYLRPQGPLVVICTTVSSSV